MKNKNVALSIFQTTYGNSQMVKSPKPLEPKAASVFNVILGLLFAALLIGAILR